MPASEFSDVFISYRRTDVEFAKKLVEALVATGKECWVDWEDIPPGSEGFTDDIKRGLEGTDAFLAILSPEYLASPYCVDMELNYAVELKKKIIPIVLQKFDGHPIPSSIGHINWIYFVPHAGQANTFEEGMVKVLAALDSDLAHAREHRKLGVRALEWQTNNKHHSFLLSGDALQAAEHWLAASGNKIPQASDLHREYIFASEKRSRDTGRRVIAAVSVALVVMVVLTILSLFAFYDASIQRATAETNLLDAWEVQSRFLMGLSESQLESGMPETALLTGLESLNHYPDVFIPESYNLLYRVLANPLQEIAYMPHISETSQVFGGVWDASNTHILTWVDNGTEQAASARIWDLKGHSIEFPHAEGVAGAAWLANDSKVITWSSDDTAKVWDAATGEMLLSFQAADSILGAKASPDESRLATWTRSGEVAIWNLSDGNRIDSYNHAGQVRGALWDADNQTVISWSEDRHLMVRDSSSQSTLYSIQHPATIEGAMLSPTGHYLMAWTLDGAVWIRDRQNDMSVLRRFRHDRRVLGATWSSDETKVLSWSEDNTARLWDVTSGGTLQIFGGHNNWVLGASFSHDESQIATWGQDGRVLVWRIGAISPHLIHSEPTGTIGVLNLHWSADDSKILFYTQLNAAYVYSLTTEPLSVQVLNHGSGQTLTGANWNADETLVTTTAYDGSARVWALNASPVNHLIQHDSFVQGARWSSDFRNILTWSSDETVRISDMQHENADLVFQHDATVGGATWNADESQILSYTWQGTVYLWNISTGQSHSISHTSTALGAIFSPDESQVLSWAQGGTVSLWTFANNSELRFSYPQPVQGASFNADGSQFMVWVADGRVDIRDTATGTIIISLTQPSSVLGAAWVENETGLLTWTSAGQIYRYDLAGTLLYQVGHEAQLKGLRLNAAGTQIMSWANDGTLRIWNSADGAVIASYDYPDPLGGAIWNKAEDRVIFWREGAGTWGRGYAYLWNPETGEILANFVHPDRPIRGVVYSPDESQVATWSWDNTVRIWTLDESQTPLILNHAGRHSAGVFEDGIWSVSWDSTGSRLLTVPSDGTARLWIVNIPQFIEFVRAQTIRGFLTVEEKLAFVGEHNSASSIDTIEIPPVSATYIPVLLEGTTVPEPLAFVPPTALPNLSEMLLDVPAMLYSGSSTDFPIMRELSAATNVKLIAQRSGWVYVQVDTVFGWLDENALTSSGSQALAGESEAGTNTVNLDELPTADSLDIADCQVPAPLFAATWAQNHWRLGCSSDQPSAILSTAQPYEHGIMTWRSDSRTIFVLLYDGRWAEYEDTYNPRDELTCSSYYTALGFGKVYCGHPEVQALLGVPMNGERIATLVVQNFEHGQIIQSVSVGRLVLVEDNQLRFAGNE